MNLSDSAIVLRPRTLTEMTDLAVRLCFSIAFGLYTRLALLLLLPLFCLALVLRYAFDVSWLGVWLFSIVTIPIAEAFFTIAISQIIFSPSIGTRAIFNLFRKRVGPLFVSFLIRIVGLSIGILTFLILFPFVAIRLLLLDESTLLEGLSGTSAYERAHRLVSLRSGDAFLVFLLLLAMRLAAAVTAELLFEGIVSDLLQLGKPFGSLFSDFGSPAAILGFYLSAPLVATARFLFYIDTRTRSDGWDVQLRFMAIRARQNEKGSKAA